MDRTYMTALCSTHHREQVYRFLDITAMTVLSKLVHQSNQIQTEWNHLQPKCHETQMIFIFFEKYYYQFTKYDQRWRI